MHVTERLVRTIRELQSQGPVTADAVARAICAADVVQVARMLERLVELDELSSVVTLARPTPGHPWSERRSYQAIRQRAA